MPVPLQPRPPPRPATPPRVAVSAVLHAALLGLLAWLGIEEPHVPTQSPSFEIAFETAPAGPSALSVPPVPDADQPPAPVGDDTPAEARPPAQMAPPPAPPSPPEPVSPEPTPPEPTPPEPTPPEPTPPEPTPPEPTPPEAPPSEPPPPEPPPPEPTPAPAAVPAPASPEPPVPLPEPPPTPAPEPSLPPPPPVPLPEPPRSRLEAGGPLVDVPRIPELDLPPPRPVSPAPPPPPPRPAPRPVPRPPASQFTLNSPGAFDLSSRPSGGGAARPRSSRTLDLRLGRVPDAAPDTRPAPADLFGQVKVTGFGPDWGNTLRAWVAQHAIYPEMARQNGEDGTASVHFEVDRDGRVSGLQLVTRSGSQFLDLATLGVFRGATVPKPPPGGADHAEVEFTINYVLIRR